MAGSYGFLEGIGVGKRRVMLFPKDGHVQEYVPNLLQLFLPFSKVGDSEHGRPQAQKCVDP